MPGKESGRMDAGSCRTTRRTHLTFTSGLISAIRFSPIQLTLSRSSTVRYGLPSMILLASTGPTPGSLSNSSRLAMLMPIALSAASNFRRASSRARRRRPIPYFRVVHGDAGVGARRNDCRQGGRLSRDKCHPRSWCEQGVEIRGMSGQCENRFRGCDPASGCSHGPTKSRPMNH
jgi:hypothetical protein